MAALSLESLEDARAAVNEFCDQTDAGRAGQKSLLVLRKSVQRLTVLGNYVYSLAGTTQLQFHRDATLSWECEHVAAVTWAHAIACPRIFGDVFAATTRCAELSDQCVKVSMDECIATLSLEHMRFISTSQRHRRTETRRSREVIGEYRGIEAADVSDWLILHDHGCTSVAVRSFSGIVRPLRRCLGRCTRTPAHRRRD